MISVPLVFTKILVREQHRGQALAKRFGVEIAGSRIATPKLQETNISENWGLLYYLIRNWGAGKGVHN